LKRRRSPVNQLALPPPVSRLAGLTMKRYALKIVNESADCPTIEQTAPSPLEDREGLAPDHPQRLRNLLAKQLRNFTALFARALAEEDADTVHDLRVCTRRLQQILSAILPHHDSNKIRSVRRTLRRVRRALGEWRNCDVVLKTVSRRRRRTSNPVRKRGWELVEESLQAERGRAVQGARRKLYKSGGITLNHRIQQLLDAPAQAHSEGGPDRVIRDAVAQGVAQWHQALERGRSEHSVENIHALRIQGKRLRYRLELARDLGAPGAAGLIQWFKLLQDRLGAWHDREELRGFIARAIGGSDVMAEQPRVAIELLKFIDHDLKASAREVDQLIHLASESDMSRNFGDWVRSYCAPSDRTPGAALPSNQHPSDNEVAHGDSQSSRDRGHADAKAQN
jgi:CHAD domain-containing protein